ncbi:hypothetical protein C8R43DRAFT_1138007 [Mycena crocata]|nr:hypothetical protein C8R43DRAFT_1138007 [Mycena crocata]
MKNRPPLQLEPTLITALGRCNNVRSKWGPGGASAAWQLLHLGRDGEAIENLWWFHPSRQPNTVYLERFGALR